MDARVEMAVSLMHQLTTDQLSIRSLSRSVNLSPTQLGALFKKETGQSPMQYLRKLRMQKAEQLLRSTFLSIKEVASLSGAKDVSHFVRDFKKEHGLTPKGFRLQFVQSVKATVQAVGASNKPTNRRFRQQNRMDD